MDHDDAIGTRVPEIHWPAAKDDRPRSSCSAYVHLPVPPRPDPAPLLERSLEDLVGQALFGRSLGGLGELVLLVVTAFVLFFGVTGLVLWSGGAFR